MATLTGLNTSAGVQPKGLRVGLVGITAVFSPNGSLSTGDVIQMFKVPANSRVIFLETECQVSGVGSFRVGDGVSTNRYINDTACSVSIGTTRMGGGAFNVVPYTYSTDDTVDVVYSGSVNASSGAIYIRAIVALDF